MKQPGAVKDEGEEGTLYKLLRRVPSQFKPHASDLSSFHPCFLPFFVFFLSLAHASVGVVRASRGREGAEGAAPLRAASHGSGTDTGRQTDRQADKQTDRQTDKQTDRQADRQVEVGPCPGETVQRCAHRVFVHGPSSFCRMSFIRWLVAEAIDESISCLCILSALKKNMNDCLRSATMRTGGAGHHSQSFFLSFFSSILLSFFHSLSLCLSPSPLPLVLWSPLIL